MTAIYKRLGIVRLVGDAPREAAMIAARIRRLSRPALIGTVVALSAGACDDGGPLDVTSDRPSTRAIISNPVVGAATSTSGISPSSSSTADVVYVSLPPGSVPDGEQATIRNRATGAETTAIIVDGGFDPVEVTAAAGDTLDFRIELAGVAGPLSGGGSEFFMLVPPTQPPVVVRTDPPPRKPDVPLNATVLVVFSEPIDAGTLNGSSLQLLLDGAPVAGAVAFTDETNLAATFTPAQPLTADADYALRITREIEDLDGDALAEELRIPFATVAAGTHVFTEVSAGDDHTCGVTAANVVYCWGFNFYGQLGIGSTSKTPVPTRVADVAGGRFTQVSAGFERTCGVTTDGGAYCWGWNPDGELGDGTTADRHTPYPVAGGVTFAQVSAGRASVGGPVAGVATNGVAYCWPACWGLVTLQPAASQSGLTFTQVSAGGEHTCGITSDYAAYCWGDNFQGEFGDGTVATEGPIPETPVAGDLSFAQLSAGWFYTCGVTTDHVAYCWGMGNGKLGDGTTDRRLAPTPVAGGLSFAQVSAGHVHTCGVTTDHAAYCWGENEKGQLGDGTTETRLTPTPVAGGLSFAQVSAGGSHTCGITTDGVVYCWGFNYSGQLGTRSGYNTMANQLTPRPIAF